MHILYEIFEAEDVVLNQYVLSPGQLNFMIGH